MFKLKGLPKKDELVICAVKRLDPHSAFVELDEFDNVNGMIHISEVALRGVKKIKNHLSVGKKVVCKVLNTKGGLVEVSLKRVNSGARKQKLNEVRIKNRFYKLVQHACIEAKVPKKTDVIVQSFIDKYGGIVNAYEALKIKGLAFLEGVSIPSKVDSLLKDSFQSLLKQLIVRIKREVSFDSKMGDGVLRIKKLIVGVKVPNKVSLDFSYKGSGKFAITIEAMNYKVAEEFFDKLSTDLVNRGQVVGVLVSFSD